MSNVTAAPPAPARLTDNHAYANPTKHCDIVMKGGITSGVVYPLAVCELARTYTFKNVGGTSAGAIAAAFTAAAEYGRGRPGGGFAGVAAVPEWVGADQNLFSLFQPQPQTKPLFQIVTAFIGSAKGRLGRVLAASVTSFPIAALVGALPGLILAVAALFAGGFFLIWGLICALLLILLGVIVAVAFTVARQALAVIPRNYFGLCNGAATGGRRPAVTPWLFDTIQQIAGRGPAEPPLTFGDLWGSDPTGERNINLEMMTTNLTMGRGFRLPFESNVYYFDPVEFRQLFPESVVKWMEEHPRAGATPTKAERLMPLPAAADLPIIVATRLSLSFPIVMSMIPLYAIDFSRKVASDEERVPERCWFSDGGMISNFPVHFFDRPLPRWPTFTINLRPFHPDIAPSADQSGNIYLPATNTGGILEVWSRFESVPGFLGAIKSTMQNWLDNAQIQQPGYRDRVAHISLSHDEGGLNLNMPPEILDRLSERGRWAGVKLRDRFALPPVNPGDLSWDNHRWVRYRTAMSVLERLLANLRTGYLDTQPGDRPYEQLIARPKGEPPLGYAWRRASQRDFALTATDGLTDLAGVWQDQPERFAEGSPQPEPDLRFMPRV